MENRRGCLRLHNLAKAYGQRPSQLVGIPDEWAAYQFDNACLVIGRMVENALDENAAKKKGERLPPEEVVRRALGEDISTVPKGRFVDLSGMNVRRVKIKEDGTWD